MSPASQSAYINTKELQVRMTSKTTVAVKIEPAVEEAAENVERCRVLITLKNFCLRNFLPIGIIFSVIIGIFLPQLAVFLSERMPVVQICIIVLFFTIGIRLRLVEAKTAVKSYKEIAVGSLLILFVGPVIAATVLNTVPQFGSFVHDTHNWRNSSNFSSEEIPILGPEEFRVGLQIYLMCPNAPAATLILVSVQQVLVKSVLMICKLEWNAKVYNYVIFPSKIYIS